MYQETARGLLKFLEQCPSAYHAAAAVKETLAGEGYEELKEEDQWELEAPGKYYVLRGGSSLIAFAVPRDWQGGYRITASHSDSPTFKIKEQPEMEADKKYVKLNVERYGGMLCAPWFDRPLSVAGRVVTKEGGALSSHLVNVDRDLVLIPSVAVHMNREANDGFAYHMQTDMLPLYGTVQAKGTFLGTVAEAARVPEDSILAYDLYLYNRQRGSIWGAREEFISGCRLDDLQCAYGTLQGFLAGKKEKYVAVYCLFDNEEVGSGTRQGAGSTFLQDVLVRFNLALGRSYEAYLRDLAGTFMISADNAHSVHPNHPEYADPVNRPVMNGGIVIKYSGNQKYCTDAVSSAMFKDVCQRAEVPYQIFHNRSDMAGGSTLGNIVSTQVPVSAVDIGLPQLAMHSPYETAGVKDTWYLEKACGYFYE
ncbi:MAG: M18 family aminopeptidase [Blautia sp.]|jgi:aspartyl aminopeptidase